MSWLIYLKSQLQQCIPVCMVAHQSNLKSFTLFNGVCNWRPTNKQPSIFYTWEMLELFELCDKCLFVLLGHIRPELEKHWDVSLAYKGWWKGWMIYEPMWMSVIINMQKSLDFLLDSWGTTEGSKFKMLAFRINRASNRTASVDSG